MDICWLSFSLVLVLLTFMLVRIAQGADALVIAAAEHSQARGSSWTELMSYRSSSTSLHQPVSSAEGHRDRSGGGSRRRTPDTATSSLCKHHRTPLRQRRSSHPPEASPTAQSKAPTWCFSPGQVWD